MALSSLSRFSTVAVAGLVGLAACAGGAGDSGPTAIKPSAAPRLALGLAADATPVKGQLKVCKAASSNVSGTFTTSLTQFVAPGFPAPGSPSGTNLASTDIEPGQCVVVAEDGGGNGIASDVLLNETSAGFVSATMVEISSSRTELVK